MLLQMTNVIVVERDLHRPTKFILLAKYLLVTAVMVYGRVTALSDFVDVNA